ncbi:hypothetical protein V5799_002785 [Amblyomma americanum]|uniref:Uncharacterized protein n=1 Tax=Amblyomma americanum TaxID=6943 RepID=A0AAQ4DAU3_AMBAM
MLSLKKNVYEYICFVTPLVSIQRGLTSQQTVRQPAHSKRETRTLQVRASTHKSEGVYECALERSRERTTE